MKNLPLFHTFAFISIFLATTQLLAAETSPALCHYSFSVVDAKTGKAIDDFTCTFPATNASAKAPQNALPTNMTLSRDKNKAVFSCISDSRVILKISAPGYETHEVLLAPASYVARSDQLKFQQVQLHKAK